MDIIVRPQKFLDAEKGEPVQKGTLSFLGKEYLCALGRGGMGVKECEGDGLTPLGVWSIRQGFYREDRIKKPKSCISFTSITKDMGWCDAPQDLLYNQLVKLPFESSHEILWRDDPLYDLILVLGYNDAPVISGKGSAIFMHIAQQEYTPTAGCIALNQSDLLEIITNLAPTKSVQCVLE